MKKAQSKDLFGSMTLLAQIGLAYGLTDESKTPPGGLAELGGLYYGAAWSAEKYYRQHPEAFAAQVKLLEELGDEGESMNFIMGFLSGSELSFHFVEEAKKAQLNTQGGSDDGGTV
jgi:hypothetical protein